MTPKFQEEMLSAYLDNELTPEQRELVERELENSPESERQLRDFQALGSLLRDLPTEPAPVDILQNIQRQLTESSTSLSQPVQHRKGLSRWTYWLASSAVALGLMATSWIYYANSPESSDNFTASVHENSIFQAEKSSPFSSLPELGNSQDSDAFSLPQTISLNGTMLAPEPAAAPMLATTPNFLAGSLASPTFSPEEMNPPLEAEQQVIVSRLESSPKLRGKLSPGELVQLIRDTDDEVTVVELNVVDINHSFGEVQVLLASNKIRLAEESQVSRSHRQDRSEAGQKLFSQSKPSASPQSQVLQLDQLPDNGLVAFYVETSDTQLLKALDQLESLDSVKGLQLGDSSLLSSSEYAVTPVDEATRDQRGSIQSLEKLLEPAAPRSPEISEEENHSFVLKQEPFLEGERRQWRRSFSPVAERAMKQQAPEQKGKTPEIPAIQAPAAQNMQTARPDNSSNRNQENLPSKKNSDQSMAQESLVAKSYQIPVQLVPIGTAETSSIPQTPLSAASEGQPAGQVVNKQPETSSSLSSSSQVSSAPTPLSSSAANSRLMARSASPQNSLARVRVLLVLSPEKRN